ncbi:MAG: hypothetical protein FWC66_05085 [Oscillospiraceae bacterium]|nr:hypothetical protein [Oscillospiraceae bacterium]
MIPNVLNSAMNHMINKGMLPSEAPQICQNILSNPMQYATPGMALGALEQVAQAKGWDTSRLANMQHYQVLKQKNADEALPYIISCAKELGIFGKIVSFFGGAK